MSAKSKVGVAVFLIAAITMPNITFGQQMFQRSNQNMRQSSQRPQARTVAHRDRIDNQVNPVSYQFDEGCQGGCDNCVDCGSGCGSGCGSCCGYGQNRYYVGVRIGGMNQDRFTFRLGKVTEDSNDVDAGFHHIYAEPGFDVGGEGPSVEFVVGTQLGNCWSVEGRFGYASLDESGSYFAEDLSEVPFK
jgi:hypothetical protein